MAGSARLELSLDTRAHGAARGPAGSPSSSPTGPVRPPSSRGGSAAGGGAGVPTRGRGGPGGEGLFRGATPAGGGSLSAARRRDPDKGDGGGRRPLCGKRVSPPPLLAPHRRLQFRVLGRPPGSSGHFSVFKNNGGGGCPGSPRGSQGGSGGGGVGMGSGDVWRAFGRWGNQGRAAAFGAGFRRR